MGDVHVELACPYNCGYCTNDGVYGRKWNALEPAQVVEETTDLVTRYNLELLWIVDDNFLVDRDRAVGIAEGLVRRGVKFDWSIQASTNLVMRLTVEELKLLRRAGLTQMSQGADTGSKRMMHLMGKDFQTLDMVYGAAERLSAAGIRPSFNLIFGYPWRRRTGASRIGGNDDEDLPPISGRGILDQHLHALSGIARHEARLRTRHRRAQDSRRLGRLLPALHRAAVAEGRRPHARAEHARIHASRVPSHPHRQVPHAGAQPLYL
ncbi:MAG: radical SAM protein [Ignavibacteriota bacterium]